MSQHPSTAAFPGVTAPAAFTDRRAGSLDLQEGLTLTALDTATSPFLLHASKKLTEKFIVVC